MLATDIVRRQFKFQPEHAAMSCEGRSCTWREVRERVLRTASALRGLGVKKGDRVAVLAFNCHRYIELYFANGLLGSVTTPLNYRLTPSELEYIINDSEAVVLIVGADLAAAVAPIRDRIPRVKHFVCIGGAEGMLDYEAWIGAAPAAEPGEAVGENDLLWQMYTSGTTGRPKGAMISHRNLITNIMQCSWEMPVRPGDCALIVAPTYHAAAVITAMNALAGGARITIKKAFNPLEVLASFQGEGVTHALLVPAMIQFLLTVPDIEKMDFGTLRYVIYGASAIPLEVLRRAMQVFRCQFVQGFGQTESTAILTMLRPEDHVLDGPPEVVRRLQSCGREVIGCEVRVVKENGEEAKPGEIGEVIARGANIMQGYWKLPEATASTLRDGWLHTGDLATVDEAGYIYIVDRIKDMIVSGGENVYPREIEEVLFTHPAVADAAVIGVPSEQWGEEVKAIVVLKPGGTATAEEIIRFCGERLAGYKRPRSVEFRPELPKNPSGKVLKRELREPYWKDKTRRVN